MNIDLAEDWRINVSKMNFELLERTTIERGDNAGQAKWVARGHYSGLRAVLSALPTHLALSPTVTTLEGYLSKWDALSDEISKRSKWALQVK